MSKRFEGYRPIDLAKKEIKSILNTFLKAIRASSEGEEDLAIINTYNNNIRLKYNCERADSLSDVFNKLGLIYTSILISKLKRKYKAESFNGAKALNEIKLGAFKNPALLVGGMDLEKYILTDEMRASIKKASKYATKTTNKKIKGNEKADKLGKSIVIGALAVNTPKVIDKIHATNMVKKFTSRMNTILETKGVETVNVVEYKKAIDEGYKYFTFYAEMDDRTTHMCEAMNETTYRVEEASPGDNIPPVHWNCRSWVEYHN